MIVPLKTKTGLEVSKGFQIIFKENKPKMLWVDKGKEYYNKNVLDQQNMVSKFILLKTKKSRLSVRDGIELLKQKCISYLLSGIILFTLTFYQKYSPLTTKANTDPLE